MKRLILVTCLLCIVSCPLLAQSNIQANRPPSVQQVMEFFNVMHLHDQMQSMLQSEQKQLKVMLDDMFAKRLPNATPDEQAKFQKIMSGAMGDMFKDFPIDDLLRDMVPIYQSHLSEADLNAIIAFYSSPVGQKVLKEVPTMTAEGMRVSYNRLQPRIEEMMKNMDTRLQEMAKEKP